MINLIHTLGHQKPLGSPDWLAQSPRKPYAAAAPKEAGSAYRAIDGAGEALDIVWNYPDRADFMIQELSLAEIAARIHRMRR